MLSAEKIQENWKVYLEIIAREISEERSTPLIEFHKKHEERFMLMPASSTTSKRKISFSSICNYFIINF
jgi:hypothetical protein